MSYSATPTLFGRATLVLGEHAHLHGALQRLRELNATLSDQSLTVDIPPARIIDEFRSQMLAHFAAEEDDGYFGTLEAESPPMRQQVSRLRSDHQAFTFTADMLAELARDGTKRLELALELQKLIDAFMAHEHAENLLIQQFFLRDDGAGGLT